MAPVVEGFAAAALNALPAEKLAFIASLPKAELHAHLNGSIPLACLQELAREFIAKPDALHSSSVAIQDSVQKLQDGIELSVIDDFFSHRSFLRSKYTSCRRPMASQIVRSADARGARP